MEKDEYAVGEETLELTIEEKRALSCSAPSTGSEVELMLWLASNMDCLSLCCTCCEDKRKELMAYFEKHGVADSHLLEDLRKAVPNKRIV